MTRVLIVYGTRYGTTKEIVSEIEKIFQEAGVNFDTYDLKEHGVKNIPSIGDYDGILIGTSVKMGMWTKHVKKFIQTNVEILKNNQDKLGFFLCCGTATDRSKVKEAIDRFITPKLVPFGLKPAFVDAYGGVYDLTENSSMGKMMQKIIIKILKEEEGIENPENKVHDYRDWDYIRESAKNYINILN